MSVVKFPSGEPPVTDVDPDDAHPSDSHTRALQGIPKRIEVSDLDH